MLELRPWKWLQIQNRGSMFAYKVNEKKKETEENRADFMLFRLDVRICSDC